MIMLSENRMKGTVACIDIANKACTQNVAAHLQLLHTYMTLCSHTATAGNTISIITVQKFAHSCLA